MFWLASRPDAAINYSQAGGSLRVEGAGAWWASMAYHKRITYPAFIEHQKLIEGRWSKQWGDRMNELVFIGKDLEKEKYLRSIEECLITDEEARNWQQRSWDDRFPVL